MRNRVREDEQAAEIALLRARLRDAADGPPGVRQDWEMILPRQPVVGDGLSGPTSDKDSGRTAASYAVHEASEARAETVQRTSELAMSRHRVCELTAELRDYQNEVRADSRGTDRVGRTAGQELDATAGQGEAISEYRQRLEVQAQEMALHRRQHAELEARCSRDAIRTGEMISRITTMRIENDALLLQRPPVAGHAALIAENTRIKAELDRSRSTSADELAQYGAHLYAVENEAAWLRQTLLEESQGLAGANAEMLRAKDEYSTQVESAREDQAAIVRSDLGARDVHAELLLQVEENQTMRTSHQQIRVELQVAQAEVQSAEAGKCDLGRSLTQVVRQCTEMREQLRAAEAGQGAHPRHPGHPGAELGELREHLVRAQMAAEEHEADARGTHEALSNESIIAQILAERLAEHETQEASRRYPGGYEPRPTASTQRYLLSPHPVSAPAKQEEDEPPDGVELSGRDKEMNAYFTRRRLLEMRDEDPAALLLEEIRGARLDVLVYAGLAGKSPLLSDDRVVDALKQRASESVAVRIILGEEHAAWAEVDELRAYDISIRCGKRVDGPYVMIDGCRALQRVDSGDEHQWDFG